MTFFERRIDCVGGRMLAYQQQQKHQSRLQQIYNRAPKNYSSTPSLHKKSLRPTKLQKHQDEEHRRNINHLFAFISCNKNMSDRLKDPHDFFAYPVYFFRNQQKVNKKSKLKKKTVKKHTNDADDLSEQSSFTRRYGIDLPTVKRLLPVLEEFSSEQIQLFSDCISRIIMNYNINTLQKVQFLKQCVLKSSMPNYPAQFNELVQQMFDDILDSLGLDRNQN